MDENKQEKKILLQPGTEAAEEQQRGKQETPMAEWILALAGLLLVLGAAGFILYRAIWGNEAPPDVGLRVQAVETVSSGYMLRFRAENRGGETLADLLVEAALTRGGDTLEKREITIDYLPANSTRRGGFFFRRNPAAYQVHLRAAAFQEP